MVFKRGRRVSDIRQAYHPLDRVQGTDYDALYCILMVTICYVTVPGVPVPEQHMQPFTWHDLSCHDSYGNGQQSDRIEAQVLQDTRQLRVCIAYVPQDGVERPSGSSILTSLYRWILFSRFVGRRVQTSAPRYLVGSRKRAKPFRVLLARKYAKRSQSTRSAVGEPAMRVFVCGRALRPGRCSIHCGPLRNSSSCHLIGPAHCLHPVPAYCWPLVSPQLPIVCDHPGPRGTSSNNHSSGAGIGQWTLRST